MIMNPLIGIYTTIVKIPRVGWMAINYRPCILTMASMKHWLLGKSHHHASSPSLYHLYLPSSQWTTAVFRQPTRLRCYVVLFGWILYFPDLSQAAPVLVLFLPQRARLRWLQNWRISSLFAVQKHQLEYINLLETCNIYQISIPMLDCQRER